MTHPILNEEKCTACGLCAEVCGLDVIVHNGSGACQGRIIHPFELVAGDIRGWNQ